MFGCTSGKDRTGLLSALVLGEPHDYCWHLGCILPRVPAMIVRTGLLGASDAAIIEDYLVSNEAVDSITFLNFRNQRRDLKTVTPTDVAMVRAPHAKLSPQHSTRRSD